MQVRFPFGLIMAVVFIAGPAWAAGARGFVFLAAPPVAAAAGQAGAAVAEGGAPWAAFFNPAGLAGLASSALSLHGQSLWGDVHHEAVGLSRASHWGGWSVTAGILGVSGLVRTRTDPSSPDHFTEDGSLRAGDQYAGAAFGRRVGEESAWGLGMTFLKEDLDRRAAWTAVVDAGFQGMIEAKYRWGVALLSVGPSAGSTPPPTRLQAGIAYAPEPWLSWEADALRAFRGEDALMLGFRFSRGENAFLRAGYRYRTRNNQLGKLNGFAGGLGGRWGSLIVDYAFQPFGDLGGEHLVSLSWLWNERRYGRAYSRSARRVKWN